MSAVVLFEGVDLVVVPDGSHDWLMSTADVAAGFGCSPEAIRQAKSRRSAELIEGRHWVVTDRVAAGQRQGVTDRHTPGGQQQMVTWTKRGVVRLGFMITSERARRFRDFAEDLVLATAEPAPVAPQPPTSVIGALKLAVGVLDEHEARLKDLEATARAAEAKQAEDRELLELVHRKVDRRDPSDPMLQPVTVTTIGSLLVPPISGAKVNRLLQDLHFQWNQDDRWVPTHEGRQYAVVVPVVDAGGKTREHLQWQRRIVPVIERRLARRAAFREGGAA